MSDKRSAYLFGMFFEEMAKFSETPGVKESAAKIYAESLDFDFSDFDLEADEALTKLGLLRMSTVEDGPSMVYGPVRKCL